MVKLKTKKGWLPQLNKNYLKKMMREDVICREWPNFKVKS